MRQMPPPVQRWRHGGEECDVSCLVPVGSGRPDCAGSHDRASVTGGPGPGFPPVIPVRLTAAGVSGNGEAPLPGTGAVRRTSAASTRACSQVWTQNLARREGRPTLRWGACCACCSLLRILLVALGLLSERLVRAARSPSFRGVRQRHCAGSARPVVFLHGSCDWLVALTWEQRACCSRGRVPAASRPGRRLHH